MVLTIHPKIRIFLAKNIIRGNKSIQIIYSSIKLEISKKKHIFLLESYVLYKLNLTKKAIASKISRIQFMTFTLRNQKLSLFVCLYVFSKNLTVQFLKLRNEKNHISFLCEFIPLGA